MAFARSQAGYSRAERLSDAVVHVTGVVSALVAVPVLVTLAVVWIGDAPTVVAAFVYGLSLLAMLSCSALYNLFPLEDWKRALRRLDQTAIYFKIAGTYTPFAVFAGGHAGWFLTGVWGAALAGVSLLHFGPKNARLFTVAFYLAMGWAGAFFGRQVFAELSPAAFQLVVVGGLTYTAGVGFFLWERLPFHYTIWHVFVLCASWILYAAVVVELMSRAPGV